MRCSPSCMHTYQSCQLQNTPLLQRNEAMYDHMLQAPLGVSIPVATISPPEACPTEHIQFSFRKSLGILVRSPLVMCSPFSYEHKRSVRLRHSLYLSSSIVTHIIDVILHALLRKEVGVKVVVVDVYDRASRPAANWRSSFGSAGPRRFDKII